MTPLDATFSLPYDAVLNKETVIGLLNHGHTRIPVYKPHISRHPSQDNTSSIEEHNSSLSLEPNLLGTKGRNNIIAPTIMTSTIPENYDKNTGPPGILKA